MGRQATALRWGVEQRLEFIEFHLFWEGGVNRSDITGYFGVSVPQASKDLSQYQELAPRNVRYDRSEKRYFATDSFKPLFLNPDADRYLNYLRSMADGVMTLEKTWLSQVPEYEALPLPRRNSNPDVLRAMLESIRQRQSIEVKYQSLSLTRPKPVWRWITPHAFAHDGHRWHVRGFCHIDRSFKDFLLPRILYTRETGEAEASAAEDTAWNEIVTVGLKPHPGLSDDQKKVVAHDYGMQNGRLDMRVRAALLYYLLKRLHLDFKEEKRLAREQHVVLANRDDVRRALHKAQAPTLSEPGANLSVLTA
jgi:predicted DNA-binding transcriptional regulator YafY